MTVQSSSILERKKGNSMGTCLIEKTKITEYFLWSDPDFLQPMLSQ